MFWNSHAFQKLLAVQDFFHEVVASEEVVVGGLEADACIMRLAVQERLGAMDFGLDDCGKLLRGVLAVLHEVDVVCAAQEDGTSGLKKIPLLADGGRLSGQ